MNIDLELLKKFYVVAEEGSITRAAYILKTSQSALSKNMNLFEYQLKTSLLNRSHKGVTLTLNGEALFEHARKILQINQTFLNGFTQDETKMRGDLKVISYPYLGTKWLLSRVKSFTELYPEINLIIDLDPDNVNPTNSDVGLGTFIPHQSHLIQKELFPDYNLIYASEEYLKKYGNPQIPDDLNNHRIISYKGNKSDYHHRSINTLVNIGVSAYQPPRKPYMEIASLSGMIDAVLEGFGIAELPVFAANEFPTLKQILPRVKGSNLPVYFIFQENRKNSKKIQVFYKYLFEKSAIYRKTR